LDRLFPHSNGARLDKEPDIDVQMGLSHDVAECIRQIISQHEGCLLIQAACMLSPNGQRMLISGAPNSGKTTLAIALSLQYGWKVIAEGMTIIDTEKNRITSFAAPFNLKPGTRAVLTDNGVTLPGFILREWFPIAKEISADDCPAGFEHSVHLEGEFGNEKLKISRSTPSEQTRKILPISNLLSVRGTDNFLQLLPAQSCHVISGGLLKDRLSHITEMCS
jgi:hypothetical protein